MGFLQSDIIKNLIWASGFYGFIFLILFVFTGLLSKFVQKKFSDHGIVNQSLITSVVKPIYKMLFVIFLLIVTELLIKAMDIKDGALRQILEHIPLAKSMSVIIFITISALNFTRCFQKNFINHKISLQAKPDIQKIDMISKSCSILILIIALLATMQSLGVSLGAIATVGGIGGLIIGFSTKDLFSNFFGLFSIYLDKPFVIGDAITILNNGISGIVEEIGLRITTIRTFNNNTAVYLPNSIFNTSIIENNSRIVNKIFTQSFKIIHDDRIDTIKEMIEKLVTDLKNFDFVSQTSNSIIQFDEINGKNLTLSLKIFFEPMNSETFANKSNEINNFLYKELTNNQIKIIDKNEKLIFHEEEFKKSQIKVIDKDEKLIFNEEN